LKTEATVHHQSSHCLNCGAHAPASFCQHCGQETEAHVPGAGEYLHEFIGHYVALESKLWKTLALLLFKPGRLTRDYIEGKRVRYVLPLRLYLTLSLIFFAVFKWGVHLKAEPPHPPAEVVQKADFTKAQASIGAAKKALGATGAAGTAQAQAAPDAAKSGADGDQHAGGDKKFLTLDAGDHNWLEKKIGTKLVAKVDKFSGLTWDQAVDEFTSAFFGYAPYAIFALMPVFALYLKLLYLGSGRRYGEHLLFALHANAFAFLTLTLMMLPYHIPYVRPALALWLTFYLPTAMRKVYGGARLATWVRWIVLMFLHLLGMVAAVVGAPLALAIVH
jgi:hypothetical protein